jgi:hypothetical protein
MLRSRRSMYDKELLFENGAAGAGRRPVKQMLRNALALCWLGTHAINVAWGVRSGCEFEHTG